MRKTILGLGLLLLLSPAIALAQNQWTESGKLAFDVTKSDIDTILKKMPPQGATDQLLRIVDMGKYNLAVGVVYRGPSTEKPGDAMIEKYLAAETDKKVGGDIRMLRKAGQRTVKLVVVWTAVLHRAALLMDDGHDPVHVGKLP